MSQVVFLSHAILFCKYLWTENMAPKHKETGTDVREIIVKCHREGKNQSELARIFDIPGSTIQSTCILKKYNEFGSVENSPKPFTQRDGTQYSRLVKLNRKKIITGDYYYDITLSVPKQSSEKSHSWGTNAGL